LARIHNKLDRKKVFSAFEKHLHDKQMIGVTSDALDDMEIFLNDK